MSRSITGCIPFWPTGAVRRQCTRCATTAALEQQCSAAQLSRAIALDWATDWPWRYTRKMRQSGATSASSPDAQHLSVTTKAPQAFRSCAPTSRVSSSPVRASQGAGRGLDTQKASACPSCSPQRRRTYPIQRSMSSPANGLHTPRHEIICRAELRLVLTLATSRSAARAARRTKAAQARYLSRGALLRSCSERGRAGGGRRGSA